MNRLRIYLVAALVACFGGVCWAAEEAVLDVNAATAGQFASSLDGVGPIMAKAIVKYRQTHGKFKSVDELLQVPGLDATVLEHNRARLSAQ